MAGRGGYQQTDGILVARLHGTARRMAADGATTERAVTELRAITTRVDLLSDAAGTHMAMFRSGTSPFSRQAADFLLATGAELELAEAEAARVAAAEAARVAAAEAARVER